MFNMSKKLAAYLYKSFLEFRTFHWSIASVTREPKPTLRAQRAIEVALLTYIPQFHQPQNKTLCSAATLNMVRAKDSNLIK